MEIKPEVLERLQKLEAKYGSLGQDLVSYLDGLLMSNTTTYWDYIRLDTLLSLQQPKTDFPDEEIFIMYHQITELYFKLSLNELRQISQNGKDMSRDGKDDGWKESLDVDFFTARVTRVNRYFEALTFSFGIMVDGMEPEQFLKYRMALLPASGFQSAQYRMIEMCCTEFKNLVHRDKRAEYANGEAKVSEMFEHTYWKQGAIEMESGQKTLTLKQFEEKYEGDLLVFAQDFADCNLWKKYQELSEQDQKKSELIETLRQLDVNVNVNWPLVHYKSAVRYLNKGNDDTPATGGTNWQKYLPPRFQKRIFYPELWTADEIENWGRGWVEKHVLNN